MSTLAPDGVQDSNAGPLGPDNSGARQSLGGGIGDRLHEADRVADAVLYEGYVLYPYRASAAKNQTRWQFGVVVPKSLQASGSGEVSSVSTESILDVTGSCRIMSRLRFLRVRERTVEAATGSTSSPFSPVDSLEVDGELWTSFDEASEVELDLGPVALDDLLTAPLIEEFQLAGTPAEQILLSRTSEEPEVPGSPESVNTVAAPEVAGRVLHRSFPLVIRISLAGSWCDGPYRLARIETRIDNITPWSGPPRCRDELVRHSLVSTHILAGAEGGHFLSSIDPPEFARPAVQSCANHGLFPVLVGSSAEREIVLAAPIILYDHPEVAPESTGDFCDATEIDEILALRVLTLTEQEKREARRTDRRAAAILDRCDTMPPEIFARLHGAIRSLRPARSALEPPEEASVPWWDPGQDASVDPMTDTVVIDGVSVGRGARVLLRPSRRADAQDLFLVGRTAEVVGVFHDLDGEVHLGVVLDDEAAELHEWYGRYLYFAPEECELVTEDPS